MGHDRIDKTIKSLISRGLITKTKLHRQNIYQINIDEAMTHPDIQHFFECISLAKNKTKVVKERVTDKKHLEVVEAFTSTHGNKSNYKIKLKLAKQESVKYV